MDTGGKQMCVLGAVSFGLNFIWEIVQMFAYETDQQGGWIEIHLFCALASVIDAIVTVGIYALLKKIGFTRGTAAYVLAAALGAVCAIVFEFSASAFGLWSYNQKMPVVPFLGVGLLPLAQLTLLVPLSIRLAAKTGSSGAG